MLKLVKDSDEEQDGKVLTVVAWWCGQPSAHATGTSTKLAI